MDQDEEIHQPNLVEVRVLQLLAQLVLVGWLRKIKLVQIQLQNKVEVETLSMTVKIPATKDHPLLNASSWKIVSMAFFERLARVLTSLEDTICR